MAPIPNALQAGPSSMLSRQSPPTITNANASTVSDAASVSGSPLPSRLTRSDVANFLPFVQDLDVLEQTDLSARLARRPTIHPGAHFIGGRHRTGIGPGSRNQAADEQEEDLADSAVDDEDEDGDARMIAGPSRARRVDGPNFAPTYQNTTTSNRLSTAKKRKRTGASTINGGRRGWKGTRRGRGGSSTSSPWDEREMVRWPVMASELHVEVSDETLEESIQSFASRFIRINNMTLVRKAWDEADGNERNQKDDNEEDDLDPVLPEALVSSTVEMVNRVLVGLAACRPADIGRRRKQMEIIDWMGVLDVAGMIPSEVE
ncbi:hypothetical protein I317_03850 [Kwoniella heveanensis CBS 569]|nr:hypothetical protein I317_03850 [Kwoniella heveanensis CBS 569]